MSRGGKRPGAGRKPNTESLKYKFQSYFTEKEVKAIVAEVKKQAKQKPELLKLIVEQLFGKPPQRVDLGGSVELAISISKEVAEKHNIHDVPHSGAK